MPFVCTVVFETDIEKLTAVEHDHPEVIGAIMKAAQGRMIGHTRYHRRGQTLDIDHYATEQDYRDFIAEAGSSIAQYGALVGAPASDSLWQEAKEDNQ